MNARTRLRRIVNAMATKCRDDDQTVATMTDDQLAQLIRGDVNARASDLTDQELEALSAGED